MIVCEFQQTDRRELEISKVLPADPQCECIAVPCFYVRMMLFAGSNRCLYIYIYVTLISTASSCCMKFTRIKTVS